MFCSKAVSEKKFDHKNIRNQFYNQNRVFGKKNIFFSRKVRHNRHFFRQNGQKFSIVEKLSFKLWSQFHTAATPERKRCTSMWEL